MNATVKKFGHPETELRLFDRWVVLLRPQQVTLGSLVIVSTEEALAFSELSQDAFLELRDVTIFVEQELARAFSFDKINYLMLMMVDPDVHFHVFPRYSEPKAFGKQKFFDRGWPGPPDLKQPNSTSAETIQAILSHIKAK